ncbi:MAG: hypothetical protein E7460_07510 [Ruminococcaceae bacterium]|nr:hypothetical protein [Oscillospiraceae bacterium]
MPMKKTLCIFLSALMLLGLFSACGNTEPQETTASTPEQTTSATTGETTSETLATPGSTLGTVIMTRTEEPVPETEAPETLESTPATSAPETTAPPTEATTTVLTALPMLGDIQDVNGVLTVGACAMEYYYASYDGLRNYAGYVNALQSYLPDVNFYAMFIPIAIAMYCPQGVNGGSDQQTVMNDWYDMMPGVIGVDTFSHLYDHRQEYLYFRTDTHWTQRGGYYAYTAFCEAADITPNPLEAYEYASSVGYLGYMHTILKGTGVGYAMEANPDTVEKFKPVSDLTARGYYDPSMTGGGYEVTVVNLDSGNYYAFTQGDQPLIHIKNNSVSNGRVAIVTKDSYGNTLVPFLADCFEEVYVVDQRHFNTDNTYSLNIVSFAQLHGVTDFIIEANSFNASAASGNFGRLLP